MSIPTIAWLTCGVRRQLETHAHAEGIPVEEMAGELITDHLRALGIPPAPPLAPDIVTAQYRPLPEGVIEHVRAIMTNKDSARGMALHRARQRKNGGKP